MPRPQASVLLSGESTTQVALTLAKACGVRLGHSRPHGRSQGCDAISTGDMETPGRCGPSGSGLVCRQASAWVLLLLEDVPVVTHFTYIATCVFRLFLFREEQSVL